MEGAPSVLSACEVLILLGLVERETGLEPATFSLEGRFVYADACADFAPYRKILLVFAGDSACHG
jgi:hypothetical protein